MASAMQSLGRPSSSTIFFEEPFSALMISRASYVSLFVVNDHAFHFRAERGHEVADQIVGERRPSACGSNIEIAAPTLSST